MKKSKITVSIILIVAIVLSIFSGCSVQNIEQYSNETTSNVRVNNVDDVSTMAETLGEEIELKRTNNAGEDLGRGRYKYTISFDEDSSSFKIYQFLSTRDYLTFYLVFRDGAKNIVTLTYNSAFEYMTGYGEELFYNSGLEFMISSIDYVPHITFIKIGTNKVFTFYSDIANLCDLDFLICSFDKKDSYTNLYDYYSFEKNVGHFQDVNYSGKIHVTVEDTQPSISIPKEPTIPNSVIFGENKSVTVDANLLNGSGAITYQWYDNSVAINGATSSIFNLSTLTVGTHKLKCKLSAPNAVDVYTTEATVTVIPKPNITITSQPQSKNIVFGDNETISVTATLANGLGELKYQWYDGETAINGATSSTLNLSTLSVGTHKLKCKISSVSADDIISNISTVVVANVPVITINSQPTAKELFVGDNVSINIGATVSNQITAPTYQWYDGTTAISGATSSTLNLSTLSVGTHQIKCVVSSTKAVSVTSNVVTINVKAKPVLTITEQPTAKEFYIGQAENLTVTATLSNGVGEIEYQWYNGTTAINGATLSTLDLTTLSVGTHQIKCVITSSNAVTVTTNIVDVTVTERPTIIITKQPEDITIVVGENKTISVTAEILDDNAELKYQWKRDNEPIENATTNSLALNDLPQGTYAFKCELSTENETVESDVATVVVEPKSGGGGGGGITPTPTPTPTESPEPTPTPTASPEPTEPPTDEPTDTTNWFAQIISAIGNFFESIANWFINLWNSIFK